MQVKTAVIAAWIVLMTFTPGIAQDRTQRALASLAPYERSHQACIIRGLDALHKDKRLRTADRMKTSIFSRAVLDGTSLSAKGGAVRSNHRWYALNFNCDLTEDLMKARTFKYELGQEIPKDQWDDLGLWP